MLIQFQANVEITLKYIKLFKLLKNCFNNCVFNGKIGRVV